MDAIAAVMGGPVDGIDRDDVVNIFGESLKMERKLTLIKLMEVLNMRRIDICDFINSFSVKPDGSMAMLLGAGASVSSGIMSGSQMVWDFKRTIYCNENRKPTSLFPDLSKEDIKNTIQSYFDAKGTYPTLYSTDEYSFYFEKCYPNRGDRKLYIQGKVRDIQPALGYLCLGALVAKRRINIITTTNFDDLIQAGIYSLQSGLSVKTISSAEKNSIGFNVNDEFPTIIKLHGDYLLDKLKNTAYELKTLEEEIARILKDGLRDKGLIVTGYAGNDNSVMTVLEKIIEKNEFGIMWCKPKNSLLSERAKCFMEKACESNELSGVVEIDNFDDLMYRMYLTLNRSYIEIDGRLKDTDLKKPILFGGISKRYGFVKTNTYEVMEYPQSCYTFSTSIKNWKELKSCHDETIVAALYKGKVWALGSKENVKRCFEGKIEGNIEYNQLPEYMLNLNDSIILGLFYDIISISICKKGYICFGKNKFYDKNSYTTNMGNKVFDAVEISLSYCKGTVLLTTLPTVHVEKANGHELDKWQKQYAVNRAISGIYNNQVSVNIRKWEDRLLTDKKLVFQIDGAKLEFNIVVYSYGGKNRKENWPEVSCYQSIEPKMSFSCEDNAQIAVNQLKGLVHYGPIEKYKSGSETSSIRLAVLTPKQNTQDILKHLNRLKKQFVSTSKSERDFLPEYTGFQNVFKRDIDIPMQSDYKRYMEYDAKQVLTLSPKNFYFGLTRYIDIFVKNLPEFDLLIIYIPKSFYNLRELKNENTYFDLHDSLKLYCAEKSIVMQVIEEKSAVLNVYSDTAKIMWGLSTGIYSKTVGRLWKPVGYNENTAFVGLSYVQSVRNGEKVSIGCSQLFDAEGNGMRLYLRPIKNPQYIQRNPFMHSEDACRLMFSLKKLYDDSVPKYNLKRVVIHKTTFFTKEEIEGISKGLAGIDDIELLQIQEFTTWRAIRFDSNDFSAAPSRYPIQRGTVIPLDDNSFLLWTHGSVQDEELAGKNRNYYKNSRGIPAPLLVRRFMGNQSGETLVNEIMMLTKMNWNSGDSFYKVLPVTLDFAKMLSKIAKQDIVIYDKPYDFRYFM